MDYLFYIWLPCKQGAGDMYTELAAIIFEDKIIASGGWGMPSGGMALSSVESYSFETNTWSYLPAMTIERYYHCACVFDGRIFVLGGDKTTSIEYFDPSLGQWMFDTSIIDMKWCYFSIMQG